MSRRSEARDAAVTEFLLVSCATCLGSGVFRGWDGAHYCICPRGCTMYRRAVEQTIIACFGGTAAIVIFMSILLGGPP